MVDRPDGQSALLKQLPTQATETASLIAEGVQFRGMALESLPPGWEVWSDEATKVVLAYRPDVFDTDAFPAPCLPTIYVSKGQRDRRPGPNEPDPDDPWYVTLYLEPEISTETDTAATRGEAESLATDVAAAFAAGELDLRGLYQIPREDYLDRLEALVGEP